jgi:hypothetical protein
VFFFKKKRKKETDQTLSCRVFEFFEKKKKKKMAARRPVRQQTFRASSLLFNDDNSDNDNGDVDMRDAMASGRIKNGRISFGDSAKKDSPIAIPNSDRKAMTLDMDRDDKTFIDLFFNDLRASGNTAFSVSIKDLTSLEAAANALKETCFNFIVGYGGFRRTINPNWNNVLNELKNSSIFDAVNKTVIVAVEENTKDLFRRNASLRKTEDIWSVFEVKATLRNLILLKQIIDRVSTGEMRLNSKLDVDKFQHVAGQEPPFLPSLSWDEKKFIWTWVQAKETALAKLYEDKTYQFVVLVAGGLNMGEYGVDKLITSARTRRPSLASLKEMPPSINDNAFMSMQRDLLTHTVMQAHEEFQKSRKADVLQQQQYFNGLQVRGFPGFNNGRNATEQSQIVADFKRTWGAVRDLDLPGPAAQVATIENSRVSERTAKLKSYLEMLEKMQAGVNVEDYRERMLVAAEWMQQPEVLQHGELSSVVQTGLADALLVVHGRCPALRSVRDYNLFIDCEDSDVVTAFAKLVTLQIMLTKFFNPARTQLDKMGSRISHREGRLIDLFKNFSFDGTKISSNLDSTLVTKDVNFVNF